MARLSKPLVLIGLMGAGKSTVGARLAHNLNLPFVDSDIEIAEAAGCSVSDIFEMYGEEIFRDLEHRVIKRLLSTKNHVVATGGGSYIQPHIRELIQRKAYTVWLRAELPVLLERVNRRDTRPLLAKGDKQQILDRLIQERYPIYAEADLVIDSDEGSHENIVKKVIETLKENAPELIRD